MINDIFISLKDNIDFFINIILFTLNYLIKLHEQRYFLNKSYYHTGMKIFSLRLLIYCYKINILRS